MVTLPAHWAQAGYGVPKLCARHGQPEVKRAKVTFVSQRPGWVYVLLLLGILPFFLATLILQRRVTVNGWPFCRLCESLRRQRLAIGIGLTTAGVAGWVANAYLGPNSGLTLFTFVLIVVGIIEWASAPRAVIGNTHVGKDGTALDVRAHQAFASYVQAATAHAAQQAEAQPAP